MFDVPQEMKLRRMICRLANSQVVGCDKIRLIKKTYYGTLDCVRATARAIVSGSGLFDFPVLFVLCVSTMAITGCASTAPRVSLAYFPPPPATARVVHLISFNSLRDLVAQKPTFVEAIRGGIVSPFVATPAGIAYRDGVLYICDTSKRMVHRWNLTSGDALRPLGSRESSLEKPVAVAVGENGLTFVADVAVGAVLSFDVDGHLIRRYRAADRAQYKPVAVAQMGNLLFVADIASHMVDIFSIDTGKHIKTIGGIGSSPGKFYYPMGVAISRVGQPIVSDMMNSRVQMFNEQFDPILEMGQPGNRFGDMGKPRQIAVGPDNLIFIADAEFQRVHIYDAKAQLLMLLGDDAGKPGSLALPIGVAIAERLPDHIASLVPVDFDARYFLFVTNTIGQTRINLFAVGNTR